MQLKKIYFTSDQLNIAYLYNADIYSYEVIKKTSKSKLRKIVKKYDFIIVIMDIDKLSIIEKIIISEPNFVFGYSENSVNSYQKLEPLRQFLFFKLLNLVDAHLVYWQDAVSFFEYLSSKPVFYLPFVHFLSYYDKFKRKNNNKEKIIIIQDGFSNSSRNGTASMVVAKRLIENRVYDKVIIFVHSEFWNINKRLLPKWFFNEKLSIETLKKFRIYLWHDKYNKFFKIHQKENIIKKDKLELIRRGNYFQYLKYLSEASLFIEINNRYSIGRIAWDCAALGVPYLSTEYSDLAKKIFPYTTLKNIWDSEEAYKIAEKLINEKGFYNKVIKNSKRELLKYLEDNFKRQFERILKLNKLL